MLPIRAIHPGLRCVGQGHPGAPGVAASLVGVAPGHHRVAAQVGEVAVLDGGPTVVARDHDGVALQAFEGASKVGPKLGEVWGSWVFWLGKEDEAIESLSGNDSKIGCSWIQASDPVRKSDIPIFCLLNQQKLRHA